MSAVMLSRPGAFFAFIDLNAASISQIANWQSPAVFASSSANSLVRACISSSALMLSDGKNVSNRISAVCSAFCVNVPSHFSVVFAPDGSVC